MPADLLGAYDVMLRGLTAADASRRQLNGVIGWAWHVAAACRAGEGCGSTAGMTVNLAGGEYDHGSWKSDCRQILSALLRQQAAAERIRLAELAAAAREEAAAAAARRRGEPGMAARHDREAARHRDRAARALKWQLAASDARGQGWLLIRAEDAHAIPVHEAIQRVGGLAEVARVKAYYQLAGHPAATRGAA